MTLVGLFVGGSSNIISAAVTADLGKQDAIGTNTDALATVTGGLCGTVTGGLCGTVTGGLHDTLSMKFQLMCIVISKLLFQRKNLLLCGFENNSPNLELVHQSTCGCLTNQGVRLLGLKLSEFVLVIKGMLPANVLRTLRCSCWILECKTCAYSRSRKVGSGIGQGRKRDA